LFTRSFTTLVSITNKEHKRLPNSASWNAQTAEDLRICEYAAEEDDTADSSAYEVDVPELEDMLLTPY
jgi:hypothetical protein